MRKMRKESRNFLREILEEIELTIAPFIRILMINPNKKYV